MNKYWNLDKNKIEPMFLQLSHQELDIYKICRAFVKERYRATKSLPPEERFNLIQQIRRAALSVQLNIAEGSSRKSELERKRFFEIARGSLVEIDAALDVAQDLDHLQRETLTELGGHMLKCFKILSKLISG